MTSLVSHSPASAAPIGEVAVTPADEIRQMVVRARRAQEAWCALSVDERVGRVSVFVAKIRDRADEIAALISEENGKPKHEALVHEIFTLCEIGHFYAANARRLLEPRSFFPRVLKHRSSTVRRVPLGVIAILSPWNFPFMIPGGDLLAALIAGNAVVLKPSEFTPLTARLLKELFDESGLPEDLFQVAYGHAAEGAALISAGVQKVVFTGGAAGGKNVAALAGENLIPCVLELGGKAPAIVCDDANVALAAKAIVYGAFANLGQACVSIERGLCPCNYLRRTRAAHRRRNAGSHPRRSLFRRIRSRRGNRRRDTPSRGISNRRRDLERGAAPRIVHIHFFHLSLAQGAHSLRFIDERDARRKLWPDCRHSEGGYRR